MSLFYPQDHITGLPLVLEGIANSIQAGLLTSSFFCQPSQPSERPVTSLPKDSDLNIDQGHSGGPVPDLHGVPFKPEISTTGGKRHRSAFMQNEWNKHTEKDRCNRALVRNSGLAHASSWKSSFITYSLPPVKTWSAWELFTLRSWIFSSLIGEGMSTIDNIRFNAED